MTVITVKCVNVAHGSTRPDFFGMLANLGLRCLVRVQTHEPRDVPWGSDFSFWQEPMTNDLTRISVADLNSAEHARAVIEILDNYARDITGGNAPLSDHAKTNLIEQLRKRSHCCVILVWTNEIPAGLAICFEGFSTFACQPVLNIQDFVISPNFRGRGLSHVLLEKVQDVAVQRKCCKLTLEVLEGNQIAKHVYDKFGFQGYQLDPKMGHAVFLEKSLANVEP
ncbi:putative acetyltransferase [Rubripirellula tenax]|uniref:Putative acetyltransferase n=1 Tax=Rubripirellula tenax TaxID=2528015 RepID=A0A5C6EIY3_9BACT|nr:GNAT family N-acetyltransferase [Rubripirellula tenax]TWU48758.1 putative acetyltransferase [Rubripirellula tenax]